jgi:formylglycine-generating enzyme required for sulfatase activity
MYPYPVGTRSPEAAEDMAGLIGEWCLNKEEPLEDVSLGENCVRVYRGGGWFRDRERVRCCSRAGFQADASREWLGFRVVCGKALT